MKFVPARYNFIPGMIFTWLAVVGMVMKTGQTSVVEPGWIIRHDWPGLLG